MTISDGFPGQRMQVLPGPRVREALRLPGVSHLVVTDSGYFPEARHHGRERRSPIDEVVVIVCTAGRGWCETAAGRFDVAAGEAVILPPGRPHAYGADPHEPWSIWWLHLTGRELAEFLVAAGVTIEQPVRAVSDRSRVTALASEVLAWMERDTTTASITAASGAAWHLLALLVARPSAGDDRSDSIDEAAQYLRTHVGERVEVAELASAANLSPSHFAALFRQRLGMPVLRYQTQLRMARARELLDQTSLSIAQISERVGYADSFYFARQFRATHGTPPTAYRAQRKG
ncbi:helix-turn-helix domain-containing protein [Agromyces sp. NPDC056965]|uniref:AraC family transcriptional regulator n=1 Tax=Agromyces sp. NPDC056965 TaxID=3345983 RepID=UPI003627C112